MVTASLVHPTLKKRVWGNCVQKIGAARMLVAPIKSLAFSLRHQVVVNTLHFTGFDKKMDAVIETTVQKLGYTEAKHLQTKSIKEFVSRNNVFVSVPTGYGKTVCYACLPLVFDTLHGHELPYSVIIVITR